MMSLAASTARAAAHAPANTRRGPACVPSSSSSSSDGSRNHNLPKGRGALVSGPRFLRNPASAAAARRTRSTRASAVGGDDDMVGRCSLTLSNPR
jgi:hypothetical protein